MGQKRIVIVEDDLIIQMFLSKVLSKAGYLVVGEARKSDEAITIIKETKPDLVLMDIGIAGKKDGIETANLLNQEFNIPHVFITGNADEATLKRARTTNPIEFIFKPIDEDRLKKQLDIISKSL